MNFFCLNTGMPAMPEIRHAIGLTVPADPCPATASPSVVSHRAACPPWLGVLGRFYQRLGRPLPEARRIGAEEMPDPYRRLLAHNRDMTATLENFVGCSIGLKVQARYQEGRLYLREVVLHETRRFRPVEYGVIAIYLDRFSPSAQGRILAEEHPFGRILQLEGVAYVGWPQAYFQINADSRIAELLEANYFDVSYGRRNVLLDERRRLLAEVIEILPPRGGLIEPKSHEKT